MLARRRVGSGDCVVSVPVHMLITTHTVRSSDFWARALAKCPQASKMAPRQMLSIFLLREKYLGQKSFWYPYICTLPADFSTPSYFTAHESSWLPSSCRRKLNAVRASLYEQYSELRGLLGEMDAELAARFPFEEFRWAWAVVNTRSVYMEDVNAVPVGVYGGEQDTCALAPVLDLLNHSDTAKVTS